jgi:glyoxylase-like metal-dependent hydrolase (beta-lactamase superfamily II)
VREYAEYSSVATGDDEAFRSDGIGPLLDGLPDSDVAAYLRTMQRLRELPATIVHAGHEPSFGRERLVELADAYLAWRGGA